VWRLAVAALPSVAIAGAILLATIGPDNPILLVNYGGAAWFLGEWLQVLALPYLAWLWVVRRPPVWSGPTKRNAIVLTLFVGMVVVSDAVITYEAPLVFMRLMPQIGDVF